MKPRASASFCHCPNETSTPVGPGRAELGVEPGRQPRRRRRRRRPGRPRPTHRRLVVEAGHVADADASGGRGTRSGRSPGTRRPAAARHSSAGIRASVGAVDEDRARRSARRAWQSSLTSVVLPAPFSPTTATTAPAGSVERRRRRAPAGRCPGRRTTRARSGCRRSSRSGTGRSASALERRRRSPPARPAAASRPARCRAGSRSRRRSRRCTPTAARRRPAPAARRRRARRARRPRTRPRRRRPAPKTAQASVCHTALPQRARGHRAVPALPRRRGAAATRRGPMPVTRTSLPGGAVVAAMNRWRASRSAGRAALLGRALDAGPPGRGQHGRQRRTAASRTSAGWIDISSADGDAEPQDPAARWRTATCTCGRARRPGRAAPTAGRGSSGRSWCAMVATDACSRATWDSRAMVTRSRKRRWTRVLTVRRNQVAAADSAEADARRRSSRRRSPSSTPSASSFEPQREQRVGQRRQQRQHEGRDAAAAARAGSRACTAATSTTAPAAGRRSRRRRRRQARTS